MPGQSPFIRLIGEVVGELDEDAPLTPGLAEREDGSVSVSGTLRLDELGQHFGMELHHDEVDCISGLVMALLDRPPAVGDTVEYERFRFTVLTVSGHGASAVRAELLE